MLLDLRIDHVATVNLSGMREIVDAVDGVEVDVREPIDDPRYSDPVTGREGVSLEAGKHHMDGELALAYARSRLAPGEDDFVRAGRQQRLVNAVRARVGRGGAAQRAEDGTSRTSDGCGASPGRSRSP